MLTHVASCGGELDALIASHERKPADEACDQQDRSQMEAPNISEKVEDKISSNNNVPVPGLVVKRRNCSYSNFSGPLSQRFLLRSFSPEVPRTLALELPSLEVGELEP